MKAAFFCKGGMEGIRVAYDDATMAELQARYDFAPEVLTGAPEGDAWSDTELLFSTWGIPVLTEEEIAAMPKLKAVFYAAGSVQHFARPYLARGIRVFSAFAANAEPVAEYAFAQITLANKGFFTNCRRCSSAPENREPARLHAVAHPGNYGIKVGILGAGAIGTKVIHRLKTLDVDVMVFDPFLPDEKASELGVEKASLERVFSECQTVSCHLANNAQTKGMLNYSLFSRMLPNATFINTGRGAQVVEDDLVRAMREAPDRTAVMDVTFPEPPEPGHPFYSLPNVFLTTHIAGSLANECFRMGRFMLEEAIGAEKGEAARWEVTEGMLKTMA